MSIDLVEAENRASVLVAEDQLSLAIGRGGQNVRLAVRLTGWKIDIRSAATMQADAEAAQQSQEVVEAAVDEEPTVDVDPEVIAEAEAIEESQE